MGYYHRELIEMVKVPMIRALLAAMRKPNQCPQGTVCYGDPANLLIGKNVSVGGNVLLYANAPIEIGDNTIIGINAILHTTTHDHNVHPITRKRVDRPIQIGSHVWIGTGAIILPGIIIEDYAVVGAGAVVSARVPKRAIVAGNPARIIGYRPESVCMLPFSDEQQIVREDYVEKYCRERETHEGMDDK